MIRSRLTIPEVVERFANYFRQPDHGAWGSLHIVLADNNVYDDSCAFCIRWAVERGDHEGAGLAELLLKLTRSQRSRLDRAVHAFIRRQDAGTLPLCLIPSRQDHSPG